MGALLVGLGVLVEGGDEFFVVSLFVAVLAYESVKIIIRYLI